MAFCWPLYMGEFHLRVTDFEVGILRDNTGYCIGCLLFTSDILGIYSSTDKIYEQQDQSMSALQN